MSLDDILKVDDAKPEIKSQASLISVMEASDAAEGPGGDSAAWLAKAEKHLNDYPSEKMNRAVEGKNLRPLWHQFHPRHVARGQKRHGRGHQRPRRPSRKSGDAAEVISP